MTFEQGKADKAEEADPNYVQAYYNLAMLYQKQGEANKAEEKYKAAIKADPQRGIQYKDGEFIPDLGEHCKEIQLAGGTTPDICSTIQYIDCPDHSN